MFERSHVPAWMRRRRLLMRVWWWIGYHGLYQIDWRLKHRRYLRTWPPPQCGVSRYSAACDDDGNLTSGWSGWRCGRVALHRGPHEPINVG